MQKNVGEIAPIYRKESSISHKLELANSSDLGYHQQL